MIGCLRTRVRKQPIIELYFESENEIKLDNLEAWMQNLLLPVHSFYIYYAAMSWEKLFATN